MAIRATPFSSNTAVSPGSILKVEIDFLGITQKDLAARMGRPTQAISEIISGKKAVTPETALELESVLGIKAHVWVNLESGYRLTLARTQEQANMASEVALLKDFNVRELEKRGWIPQKEDSTDKVAALRKFLGIASLTEYQRVNAAAYRITGGENYSPHALAVWLRKGELGAEKIETAPYNQEDFARAIRTIRGLNTASPDKFIPKMKQLCASAGVALVLTPELPKSGANGVARRLSGGKPMIQLSLKWRWADIFWFTFFHEAGHILNHKRDFYIQYPTSTVRKLPEELEADQFAADTLIPPAEWRRFVDRGILTAVSVCRFASSIDIHPGVVVGRLHHEGLLPYNKLSKLKRRFHWVQKD